MSTSGDSFRGSSFPSSSSAGNLPPTSIAPAILPDGGENIIFYLHQLEKPNQIDDHMKSSPVDMLFRQQGWVTKLIDENALRSEYFITEEHSTSNIDLSGLSNDPSPVVSSDSEDSLTKSDSDEGLARSDDETGSPPGGGIPSVIDELGSRGRRKGGLIKISSQRRRQSSSEESDDDDEPELSGMIGGSFLGTESKRKRSDSSEESDDEDTPKEKDIISPVPKKAKQINTDIESVLLGKSDAKRKREDDLNPERKDDKGKEKAIAVPAHKRFKKSISHTSNIPSRSHNIMDDVNVHGASSSKSGLSHPYNIASGRETQARLNSAKSDESSDSSENERMSYADRLSSSSMYIETFNLDTKNLSNVRAIITLEAVIANSPNTVALREMLESLMQSGIIVIVFADRQETADHTSLIMTNFFQRLELTWVRTLLTNTMGYKYNHDHKYADNFEIAIVLQTPPYIIHMEANHAMLQEVPRSEAIFRAIGNWPGMRVDYSAIAFAEVGDGYLGYFGPMKEMGNNNFMLILRAMLGADIGRSEKERFYKHTAKELYEMTDDVNEEEEVGVQLGRISRNYHRPEDIFKTTEEKRGGV